MKGKKDKHNGTKIHNERLRDTTMQRKRDKERHASEGETKAYRHRQRDANIDRNKSERHRRRQMGTDKTHRDKETHKETTRDKERQSKTKRDGGIKTKRYNVRQ